MHIWTVETPSKPPGCRSSCDRISSLRQKGREMVGLSDARVEPAVPVSDMAKAKEFYVGKLGFQVRVQMPLGGDNRFVMLALPDGGAHLVFSLATPGRWFSLSR